MMPRFMKSAASTISRPRIARLRPGSESAYAERNQFSDIHLMRIEVQEETT